jgi:methylase of polypeptide subunit release factors
MAVTSRVIHEAAAVLVPGGLLALEVDARRASLAAELAMTNEHFAHVSLRLDLAGRERILMATRKET